MSYILDALNKSETNRSATLATDTAQPDKPGTPVSPGRSRWPIILFIVAIVSATGLWLMSANKHALLTPIRTVSPSITTTEAPYPAAKQWTHQQLPSADIKPVVAEAPTLAVLATDEELTQLRAADITDSEPADASSESESYVNIPDRSQLPSAQQAELPDLRIEGHIYDETPARRMVIINGQIGHEKQRLGNGLTIEEITTDGAILSHHGTAFHIGTFDNP